MFHHIHLVLLALVGPVASVYGACAAPCLWLLRLTGRRPRPASADEDLTGRVIIVTGANTGKWRGLPAAAFSRHTRVVHATVYGILWCLNTAVIGYRFVLALSLRMQSFDVRECGAIHVPSPLVLVYMLYLWLPSSRVGPRRVRNDWSCGGWGHDVFSRTSCPGY